jgi:hypothetical protein
VAAEVTAAAVTTTPNNNINSYRILTKNIDQKMKSNTWCKQRLLKSLTPSTTTSTTNILQAFLHQTAAECWCSCISATLPLPSRTNEHDGSCLEAYAPCMTDVKNSRLDPPFSQAQAEADFMLWQRAKACNITVI